MAPLAWAEIDLAALAHNVRAIKNILRPGTQLMAIVKANAYGHGAGPVARTALSNGATCLGVATLDEALELRQEGISAPVLILGYTPAEEAAKVVAANISQTVYSLEQAAVLNQAAATAGVRARLHLKIDTGMGRLGLLPAQAISLAGAINDLPYVCLEGLFTHFASSDAADKSYARRQLDTFLKTLKELERRGISFPWIHAANSGAIIDLPETHFNLARAGIILYGHYPSGEVHRERLALKPVMTLKAKVILVKELAAGKYVGYGCTYVTPASSQIATLPIGYGHGYSRLLSNRAQVLIRGRRAPVIGQICMDQCMVDVTSIPGIQVDEEVVLFGCQEGNLLTVDEVAAWMGTINYEILCLISRRVPRLYLT